MRNKHKQRLKKRHQEFEKHLQELYDKWDKDYPGWRDKPDADYIKKRLRDHVKNTQKNKIKIKQKIIKKKNYEGMTFSFKEKPVKKEWPFTVDEIILVQRSKKMISCIVKQGGLKEYALNGLAATGLKLKSVHDASIAIEGKSISDFIKIGMEL